MKELLRRSIQSPILSQVVMLAIFGSGLYAVLHLRRDFLPYFSRDALLVTVVHKGASARDVEEGISIKVEEAIEGTEGVRRIESVSREGVSIVRAEVDPRVADLESVMQTVRTEVDRLELPDDAEEPAVVEERQILLALQVAIHGDVPEQDLKVLAEEVREELLALPQVSQVEMFGTRPWEISIEVSDVALRSHGLRIEDVVRRIQTESLDLPAGSIQSTDGEILIRTEAKRRSAREYEDIVVLARADGTQIRLGQIGRARESFENLDERGRYGGQRAAFAVIYKTADEDLSEIAASVHEYVAAKGATLPPGVHVAVSMDTSRIVDDRIALLLDNGIQGMVLIFFTLWLFMDLRLAWWVAWGVPTAVAGTLFVLWVYAGAIDMAAAFAFILALGLLDDAIVVSENIYVKYRQGLAPVDAAVEGTREVVVPVLAASVTTCVAFAPLLFVDGQLGKMMEIIPVVVIGSMAISLLECLVILPSHLAHGFPVSRREGRFTWVRHRIDQATEFLIHRLYTPVLRLALRYKTGTLALAVASVGIAGAMMEGGHVKFSVFGRVEADFVKAEVQLPYGTSIERTEEVVRRIEEAARRVDEAHGGGLIHATSTLIGKYQMGGLETGSHVAEVDLELVPSESRGLSSDAFIAEWRTLTGQLADVERIVFLPIQARPDGKPFEIRLHGTDLDELRRATEDVKRHLAMAPGVVDIQDDDHVGKLEFRCIPKPAALALGITPADMARQLRSGFFGQRADVVQRGREPVEVVVRYPQSERRSAGDFDATRIRTPSGDEVPLSIVADVQVGRGLTQIRRVDGRRSITVSAENDNEKANVDETTRLLEREFLRDVPASYRGVSYALEGQRRHGDEALGSMIRGAILSCLGIFVILAVTYRSWLQPSLIMAAIPYTTFGVVMGHWLLGYDLTLLSISGMVCLGGIVINDSIVFVEFINDALARGLPLHQALLESGGARFRPNIASSLTTVVGVFPIVLESSADARFLSPMAIAVSAGMLFATGLTLFAIPALFGVINDARRAWYWIRHGRWPTPEEVEPAVRRSRASEAEDHPPAEAVPLPEVGPIPAAKESSRRSRRAKKVRKETEGPAPTRLLRRGRGIEELLERASELAEKGEAARAIDHYEAALRIDPERHDVRAALGMARCQLEEWEAAIACFDEALDASPGDFDLREYRAWAHLRAGNFDAARSDFEECLREAPDNLIRLQGRAAALAALGRYDEAIDDLGAALERAPRNAQIYFLRAETWRKKGEFERALADFDLALERDANNPRALHGRALCRADLGDRDGAFDDLDAALHLDPDFLDARSHRARIHIEVQRFEEAATDLSRCLAQDPDRHDLHLARGQARAALDDVVGASADFRTYLQHFPKSKQRRRLERYLREHVAASVSH